MTSGKTNPRYVAFAHSYGRTVEEQQAYDQERWPGGCMCGFLLWISEQKALFHAEHPEAFFDRDKPENIVDFEAWDVWLEQAVLRPEVKL